jgi:hypothetical protein
MSGESKLVRVSRRVESLGLGLCETNRLLTPQQRARKNSDLAKLAQARGDAAAKSGSVRLSS